jgi:hypothetical protein
MTRRPDKMYKGGKMWWDRAGKREPSAMEGTLHSRKQPATKSAALGFLFGVCGIGILPIAYMVCLQNSENSNSDMTYLQYKRGELSRTGEAVSK